MLDDDDEDGAIGGGELAEVAPSGVKGSGIDPSRWEQQELGTFTLFYSAPDSY